MTVYTHCSKRCRCIFIDLSSVRHDHSRCVKLLLVDKNGRKTFKMEEITIYVGIVQQQYKTVKRRCKHTKPIRYLTSILGQISNFVHFFPIRTHIKSTFLIIKIKQNT